MKNLVRLRNSFGLLFILLGIIIYLSWIAEQLLPTEVSPIFSYASELAARSERHGNFFATADSLTGILFLAGAASWKSFTRPARRAKNLAKKILPLKLLQNREATLLRLSFATWGGSTLIDSFARLGCVETAGQHCPPANRFAEFLSATHVVSSSVASTFSMISVVLIAYVVRNRIFRATATTTAILYVTSALSAALVEFTGVNLAVGIWQRSFLLIVSLGVFGWIIREFKNKLRRR